MTINITTLFSVATAEKLFSTALEVAQALGLPVTTWRTGDPTRSLYKYLARVLAERDSVAAEYIKAGFLSSATGEWLKVLAVEVFGVTPPEATYATPTVTVTNSAGGFYDFAPGDVTFKNSITNATYHNTNQVSITPGDTEIFELIADEAGSDGSSGTNEIDAIVASPLGLTIVSSTVGLANDEASENEVRTLCRATLGALSPNGPPDAYVYVALNPDLTGNTSVNRANAVPNAGTGAVTVTIATQSGPADGAAIAAVQDAIELWATPLCVTPTVVSAAVLSVDRLVTITKTSIMSLSDTEIQSAAESGYADLFRRTPIGGVNGLISEDEQTAMLRALFLPGAISRITGADDIELTASKVPVVGTIVAVVQ